MNSLLAYNFNNKFSINDRIKFGVKKYGFNSKFVNQYHALCSTMSSDKEIEKLLDDYDIQEYEYMNFELFSSLMKDIL